MIMNPVLSYQPAPGPDEYETVTIACGRCGETHIHGAGDGFRGANCRWAGARDYWITGTGAAKARYARGDRRRTLNPYRSNCDLARILKKRWGWDRVPIDVLTKAIGTRLITHNDPGSIRTAPANWIASTDFITFCWRCLNRYDCRTFYDLDSLYLVHVGNRLPCSRTLLPTYCPDQRLSDAAACELGRRFL